MTWEQKLMALNAIVDHSLLMRKPGDWYLVASVEIAGDGFLRRPTQSGKTPEQAVDECWRQYVDELKPDEYLYAGSVAVKWNGFMWADASYMRKMAITT